LSDRWSEAQQRKLIQSAVSLYRKRGTRQGLQEYLEIFGEKVQIIEHRAHNLRLGRASRLGPDVALGTDNIPNTFTVLMRMEPTTPRADRESARRASERRQMVKTIIEAEKPAHTAYILRIETGT
jgi:hypothetical protein